MPDDPDHALTSEEPTNRSLYLAITQIIWRQKKSPSASRIRTLEEYLSALWALCQSFQSTTSLTPPAFLTLLEQAFTANPLPYDPAWAAIPRQLPENLPGYFHWETAIRHQIVDLHEMDASGVLKNDQRFFGIHSPRGSRWYNFHPFDYLECAATGSIGGWEPEDDTGRSFVPGPVTVVSPEGAFETMDPEDVPRPVFPLTAITWEQFKDFLMCGQMYE